MRKKILFVDDEPAILELFQFMFRSMGNEWEVQGARSGAEALAMMEQSPSEVVVSDMRMPDINGAQLLTEIMKRWPKTARIILSGYAEHEAVAKCVGAAHQYLMKPCDIGTLKATLTRVCALDVFLRNEHLKSLVAQMSVLPSLPSLYFRVLEELQSPMSSLERIGELVAMDLGMTAKLLQLVNSAFFGVRRQISNPAEAVQLLGVGTVRSLALSIHAFSCFDRTKLAEFSFERLWNHSLMAGLFAKKIAESENAEKATIDEAFIAGLLHDVGKLMLLTNMPESYRQVLTLLRGERQPIWQVEEKLFGANHADVGAYLLGLWGLPVPIVEAVALHHHPVKAVNPEFCPLTAVHVANVLEQEYAGACNDGLLPSIDEGYLASLSLQDRTSRWRGLYQLMVEQSLAA